MPLPWLTLFAFVSGLAAATASSAELRVTPRPALLTKSFVAYLAFAVMVLLPASAYFYLFYGDWFLLYLIDTQKIPSAIALMVFLGNVAVGAGGFALGSALLRSQRSSWGMGIIGAGVMMEIVFAVFLRDRLSTVGSYAQYSGRFGLAPFADTAILPSTVVIDALVIAALSYLLARLYLTGRRGG